MLPDIFPSLQINLRDIIGTGYICAVVFNQTRTNVSCRKRCKPTEDAFLGIKSRNVSSAESAAAYFVRKNYVGTKIRCVEPLEKSTAHLKAKDAVTYEPCAGGISDSVLPDRT